MIVNSVYIIGFRIAGNQTGWCVSSDEIFVIKKLLCVVSATKRQFFQRIVTKGFIRGKIPEPGMGEYICLTSYIDFF